MDQFRNDNNPIEGTEYDNNHKINWNTPYPSIPIKKEIDTTMDDFDYSIKLEPLSSCVPIKKEIDTKMHNYEYSTKLNPYTNIKQEIDTGGDDFDYSTEAKTESKPMGVEQFLSNLFSRNANEASIASAKTSGTINYPKVNHNKGQYSGSVNYPNINHNKVQYSWTVNDPKGNYFKCQYCSYTGSSWLHYKNHREIHKEKVVKKELYQCTKCNKFFQQTDVIVKHKGRGRSKISKHFKCVNCEKDQEIHTGEKLQKCSHCGLSFPDEPKLIMHLTVHSESGLEPNQCSHCGKCCVSAVGLARHRRLAAH